MALPITLSYTFGNSTSAIPLVNLDSNFTTITTAVNSLGDGTFSFSALTSTGDATFSGTGQVKLPSGTTAQRSGTPVSGMIRYNTTLNSFEGYSGSSWGTVGGGSATGGGNDHVFVVNDKIVTTSYSIVSTQSAMSTGPITINSGVTVTIPSGSKWVVL